MIHWKHMIAAGALLTSTIAIAANYSGTEQGDEIHGTAGDDIINGNGGNDRLFGEGGRDLINGGTGYNSLTGGAGFDTFRADRATSTTILDLETGEAVQISCKADWGGPQKNLDTLLNYGHDTPNGDMTFLGRDGTTVIFKGLTYAQASAALKYPAIQRSPTTGC